ncbi:MAG: hypothetical protein J0I75_16465, partial [Hyphomicrobium sp.]|nr:hypothetical protein [Hyphomicrobium sp.]
MTTALGKVIYEQHGSWRESRHEADDDATTEDVTQATATKGHAGNRAHRHRAAPDATISAGGAARADGT